MIEVNSKNAKSDAELEAKIWRWLDDVIIKENLCPFAKVPRANKRVKLLIVEETADEQLLGILANECLFLASNPTTETTLIAFSKGLQDFYDYLDMLDVAKDMLEELGYEGIFQLASFHPQYLFAGEPSDSVSHYTNRAPAPIFHIIREASITKALEFVDNPDTIPTRNIEHAHALGLAFFKAYL